MKKDFDRWCEKEKVVVLIHRYDIESVASKLEARNLLALMTKHLSYERVEVGYRENALSQSVRQQTKLYNIDKIIAYFDGKVKGGDTRFVKSWNKYLKILKKLKELKTEEPKEEKS